MLDEGINHSLSGKGQKAFPKDPISESIKLECGSATDLHSIQDASFDLVITDPPFGNNIQYSELSDFFYVWLRLAFKDRYPDIFGPAYAPKSLEVVSNRARHPEDPDNFYKRLLTECWQEAYRILKQGGILSFTFHHSEDAPWIAVLESLFEAGFYIEAIYPIRGDESKGDGQFGSQKVEYDMIHVCQKRRVESSPVSWAKMRREVLKEVHHLKSLLEHHSKAGLPDADLQVIRRGKALEYYSRHYGKVFIDAEKTIGVAEALAGINQILDEESGAITEPPPVNAEPFTRLFLRMFDRTEELPRDQIQKFLRGTGITPDEYEDRGWCHQDKKIYYFTSPKDIAQEWYGKHRQKMIHDYDQAAFLIGSCFTSSGINATDTLNNVNFIPHPALGDLLEWFSVHGATQEICNAATIADRLYGKWKVAHKEELKRQMTFFDEEDG
jgi:hypothetical protein